MIHLASASNRSWVIWANPNSVSRDGILEQLANEIDVIYHNGAMVNFVYPYHAHKASNVLGTQEVLRLASQIKLKPSSLRFHFIDFIFGRRQRRSTFSRKMQILDQVGAPFGGYAQSKWVAEKLVTQAGARGIPCAIYRPGLVSGHSMTGAWNTENLISSMTRACVLLGSVPNLDVMVNIVPVDFVSCCDCPSFQKSRKPGQGLSSRQSRAAPLQQTGRLDNGTGFPCPQCFLR